MCVISLFFIFTYINLNSFFLNVSFPRTRREVPSLRGDRGKSAYTGQNHSFVSTHACPFRRLRRHLPRSRGRLFCESFPYFSILLILFSIFCVCPHLPLPSANADTLAKAKRLTHFYSVALLLKKWFACFPTSGDSLGSLFLLYFPSCKDGFFYLICFFIFLFVTHKKAGFLFSGQIKMTRFGESLHKGYSHGYYIPGR